MQCTEPLSAAKRADPHAVYTLLSDSAHWQPLIRTRDVFAVRSSRLAAAGLVIYGYTGSPLSAMSVYE